MEMIAEFIAQELLSYMMQAAQFAFVVIAGWAANLARKYLGEKNTDILRARLSDTIDRGIATAAAAGVTDEALAQYVEDFVANGIADTVGKLTKDRSDLRRRVASDIQINKVARGVFG